MNNHAFLIGLMALVLSIFSLPLHAQEEKKALDFGDEASATLVGKAWAAFTDNNDKDALAFCARCIKLYERDALKQQAALNDFAPEATATDYWALNDVGTSYYIIGQVQDRTEGDEAKKKAKAAYKILTEKLGYCQCWDTQGWFWRPAEAAATRLSELSVEE